MTDEKLTFRDIQLKYQSLFDTKKDDKPPIQGVLTEVSDEVEVEGRDQYVWYTPLGASNPSQVLNRKVSPKSGLPVKVGIGDADEEEVLGVDMSFADSVDNLSANSSVPHRLEHQPGGGDMLWIDPRQLLEFAVYPAGGLFISITSGYYRYGNQTTRFAGLTGIDISSSQPLATQHRAVGVYIDLTTNAVSTVDGTAVLIGAGLVEPTWPTNALPIAIVDLDGVQTSISFTNDIISVKGTVGDSIWKRGSGGDIYYNEGDVGIGTASPATPLHISKDAAGLARLERITTVDNFAAIQIYNTSTGGAHNSGIGSKAETTLANSYLYLTADDINIHLAVRRDGNVGIATASPDFNVQVGDGANTIGVPAADRTLFVGPDGGTGRLILEGTAQADIVLVDGGGGVNDKSMQLVTISGVTKFRSINDIAGVQVDDILAMDHSTGDVGIGTASPTQLLEVRKDQNAATLALVTNNNSAAGTSAGFQLAVDSGTAAGGLRLFGPSDASRPDTMLLFAGGGVSGGLKFESDAGPIVLETAFTEAMRIDTSQKVGIGTASPREALEIGGGGGLIVASNVYFNSNNRGFFMSGYLDFATGVLSNTSDDIEIRAGSTTARMVVLASNGNVGIGVSAPQGKIHTYGSISGFLLWEYDGLDATVRTIIPNGTGDVLYRLYSEFVLRDSAGAVNSGVNAGVSPGASTTMTVGTNNVRLRVNADGSIDIARTSGSDTIKVALTLRWS